MNLQKTKKQKGKKHTKPANQDGKQEVVMNTEVIIFFFLILFLHLFGFAFFFLFIF
jgi:hypothetical protein